MYKYKCVYIYRGLFSYTSWDIDLYPCCTFRRPFILSHMEIIEGTEVKRASHTGDTLWVLRDRGHGRRIS